MSIFDQIEAYFRGKGYTPAQTKGIAAGIYAESGGNPLASNPTSGAFGIGQWLGSRKAGLISRYGSNPSVEQQLDYLHWELQGGDYKGRNVLQQTTATGTLTSYIKDFMRPAAGHETSSDLARGRDYLAGAGGFSGADLSSGSAAGRKALDAILGPDWGTTVSNGLFGLGDLLATPGNAIDGAVASVTPDWNAWFQRGALLVFALILIAAAVFAFKGGDAINLVKAGVSA